MAFDRLCSGRPGPSPFGVHWDVPLAEAFRKPPCRCWDGEGMAGICGFHVLGEAVTGGFGGGPLLVACDMGQRGRETAVLPGGERGEGVRKGR